MSDPIWLPDLGSPFIIQPVLRQSSALGRSSGFGCRTSRRKSSQVTLKPAFLTAGGGEDVAITYLYNLVWVLNKGLLVTIRYKIHPKDQMSVLLVLGVDVSSISGAV